MFRSVRHAADAKAPRTAPNGGSVRFARDHSRSPSVRMSDLPPQPERRLATDRGVSGACGWAQISRCCALGG